MTELDQIDLSILSELQRNGRAAFTDIAKNLDISEGTVRNRVQRMTKENLLQVVGMVDPLKLGYDAPAMIGVSVHPAQMEAAAETISRFEEVSYLIMVSGEFDLYVEVMCRDRDHLASFLNEKLRQVAGVTRTQTFIILRTYKLSYAALPSSHVGSASE